MFFLIRRILTIKKKSCIYTILFSCQTKILLLFKKICFQIQSFLRTNSDLSSKFQVFPVFFSLNCQVLNNFRIPGFVATLNKTKPTKSKLVEKTYQNISKDYALLNHYCFVCFTVISSYYNIYLFINLIIK